MDPGPVGTRTLRISTGGSLAEGVLKGEAGRGTGGGAGVAMGRAEGRLGCMVAVGAIRGGST